ncbi:MAG: hypothetical protein LQ346_008650 [Caloplaca aetnensis]|nr:MAG: hypothetical protein LQ346_008650 [Caloplaca aetnensis]
MADPQEQQQVFNGILEVLQRIEAKLETHETRVKQVEDLIQRSRLRFTESAESSSFASTEASSVSWYRPSENNVALQRQDSHMLDNRPIDPHHQLPSNPEALSVYSKGGPKIRYGYWRSEDRTDDRDEMLDESHFQLLEIHLGGCAAMPDDERLPLNLGWRRFFAGFPSDRVQDKYQVARRLETLRTFDADLRAQPGNDFLIVDFDTSNNSRIYRVGQEAVGSELMVSSESPRDAPWSRLILYQGMTTGNSMKQEFDNTLADPIPYFNRAGTSTGLWDHVFSHLRLKRRSTSSNPYANSRQGFHTTFYDIRETKDLEAKELWRQGPLYDHPLGWHFLGDTDHKFEMTRPHWTMLVLAPGGFFGEHNSSFPITPLPKGSAQALGHCLGRLTRAGAELNLIAQGLAKISERWAAFQNFFDYILDNGDSLMQPTDHDNLLFDDGSFSRSRRYFWAITCLSEFENAITDNISQWELYKAALPILDNDLDNIQYRNVERQCRVLQNQREYFRQKLASTRALRDALFNASAVIESRASTRLGENVKLLTFVSVFFIPLSFCTSLWSVNNMFSMNSLIAVIVVVALLTYTTVLNINSLVTSVGSLYDRKKRRVINAMKKDEREGWKHCGQRFESFRPKHENPKPSEWYIMLYAMLNPAAVLGLSQWSKREVTATRPGDKLPVRWFGIPNRLWRKQRDQPQEAEQPDEAWVF